MSYIFTEVLGDVLPYQANGRPNLLDDQTKKRRRGEEEEDNAKLDEQSKKSKLDSGPRRYLDGLGVGRVGGIHATPLRNFEKQEEVTVLAKKVEENERAVERAHLLKGLRKEEDKENEGHVKFSEPIASVGETVEATKLPSPTKTPRSILKNRLMKQQPKIFLKNESGSITSSPLLRQEASGNYLDGERSPLKSKINSPQSPTHHHQKIGHSPVKLPFKSSSGISTAAKSQAKSVVSPAILASPPPTLCERSPLPYPPSSPPVGQRVEAGKAPHSPFKSPASVKAIAKTMKSPQVKDSPRANPLNPADLMRLPPPTTPPSKHNSTFRPQSPGERFSLSSPLLRRQPSNPEYIPVSPDGSQSGQECPIRDYYFDSDDQSESEDDNLLRWCRKPNLHQLLLKQESVDPDPIFGPPYADCDLTEIFSVTRRHYARTNRFSGEWVPPYVPLPVPQRKEELTEGEDWVPSVEKS